MARLWSCGFELQSLTDNVEVDSVTGSPTINTTIKRSGNASLRANTTAATAFVHRRIGTGADNRDYFLRFYLYIATLPNATEEIARMYSDNAYGEIHLTSSGTLQLFDAGAGAQRGSDSAALNTGQWYRIEIASKESDNTITARLDGTQFATGASNSTIQNAAVRVGMVDTGTADLYFDDVAVNDDTGSFQNSYPGEGEIIHLMPNAAGDNVGWTRAGTDTGANWSQMNELPPDDVTTVVKKETLDTIDDYNIDATPAALDSSDIINVVQVGFRFRVENTIGADPAFVLRVKAAASGTVEEGSPVTASTNFWHTNAVGLPRNYNLTLYDLPGASTTPWTKADLDTSQIGMRISTGDTHPVQASGIWLLVDHKASAGSVSSSISSSVSSSPSPSSSISFSVSSSISSSISSSLSSSPSPSSSVSSSISQSVSASPSPGYTDYSRGDEPTLPSADADLETIYSAQDVTDVETSDDVRVAQAASGQYAIHLFKEYVSLTGGLVRCEVQSSVAASVFPIFLQVYNRDSITWETLDTDNTTAADTDLTLEGVVADLTDYKDGNMVACRVYQLSN